METEGERYQLFSRRALLMFGGQGLLASALFGRMYYLGVVEAEQFAMLAEDNRVSMHLLAPIRGEIADRQGVKLATNRKDFRIFLIPEQARDIEETLIHLQLIFPLSEGELRQINRQIQRQREFLPVTIAENLSWEEFAAINVDAPHLAGIQPDAGETRFYPQGHIASNILGYVGQVTVEDRRGRDDPILQLPGFKLGHAGLEKTFDEELRGKAGDAQVEVNAFGRVIRELNRNDSEKGKDVILTVDAGLQAYMAERMADQSAAAVVMDVTNGDILGMASTPSFNSNDFNFGISVENWESLRRDPRKPLLNKCIAGQYAPGSTFKMIVAIAALEADVIPLSETVRCNGRYVFGDRTFHCWEERGHGRMDMIEAIARSCDVYFYEISQRVGIDKIIEVARRFGLGEAFEIGLSGQQDGNLPTREWYRETFGIDWLAGETLNVGIGQGALLTTPLQLATMAARIASGEALKPRLVHSVGGIVQPREAPYPLEVSAEHLAIVRRGMQKVMEPGGTAYGAALRSPNHKIAGKSGTTQVRAISQQARDEGTINAEDRAWNEREHALFVAFSPIEAPKYALSVLVEHGGGGSSVAGPIASDIMREVLIRDPSKAPPITKLSGRENLVPGLETSLEGK